MSELNLKIGKKIASLRKEQKMTQEQLAEKLDISVKHCSSVERGLSSLSLEKLIQVCEIFNVSLDFLVRNLPSEESNPIPSVCISLFQNADEKERRILKEYLSLYNKIKKQSN